jgi:hypothetical protein
MNENTGQMSSCLAIAENRVHKPGGCVGIFFQLFDWNRRFAKKKLFSKKLLPPGSQNPHYFFFLCYSLYISLKNTYMHVPFDKM